MLIYLKKMNNKWCWKYTNWEEKCIKTDIINMSQNYSVKKYGNEIIKILMELNTQETNCVLL
jgi:hypothetical protein